MCAIPDVDESRAFELALWSDCLLPGGVEHRDIGMLDWAVQTREG